MNTEQILMCVVALILGMLLANMLKSVCGCKVVEGQEDCLNKCKDEGGSRAQRRECYNTCVGQCRNLCPPRPEVNGTSCKDFATDLPAGTTAHDDMIACDGWRRCFNGCGDSF
jgi:hypothetical protein